MAGEGSGTIKAAEDKLKALYEIHDYFFSPSKDEKRATLKQAADEVHAELDKLGEGGNTKERAKLAFVRGRALDVFSEYSAEAEACLSRAVKLAPSDNIDAWNALGHCFWKKWDLPSALNCFKEALSQKPNKESLRHLSMVLRQLPGDGHEKLLTESLQKAKEAVALDLSDAHSWYVLGNAHVAIFFRVSHSTRDLQRAIQAYTTAESHGGENNPDLYFNKARVHQFLEEYQNACKAYSAAHVLDPQLPAEDALSSIRHSVERTSELVERKGKLKLKRIRQLTESLHLADVKLGEGIRGAGLSELQLGKNEGLAVALKVIMPVSDGGTAPEKLLVVDESETCTVLSLYHLDQRAIAKLYWKDVLIVVHPNMKHITLGKAPSGNEGNLDEGDVIGYKSITVNRPTDLLINGKAADASFAPARLKLSNFDK
ncbi:unnamed protein product [Chrysoparadoxa australica]